MVHKLFRLVTIVLLVLSTHGISNAESLRTLYETSLEVDWSDRSESVISALRVGDDTMYCGSQAGIFARFERDQPWQKLMDCHQIDTITNWWDACYKKKAWKQLIDPSRIWQLAETNEIIIFDNFCGCLTKLRIGNEGSSYAKLWKADYADNNFLAENINLQGKFISGGISFSSDSALVAIGRTNKQGYRKIFDCSESLLHRIDSVCNLSYPTVFPALNPIDSTLWVAVEAYDFIYVTDLDGKLVDSIHISASSYRLPEPPKSRLQTKAVYLEWKYSGWTAITGLWYVSPGYLILQYRNGWVPGLDSIPSYSAAIWNADRKSVELDLGEHWQVAGVQPDGEIILGRFMYESNQRVIGLRVVRIEP